MAHIKQAKTENEIKTMTVSNLKKEYISLAEIYTDIIDGNIVKCNSCAEFLSRKNNFYISKSPKYVCGFVPICKKCLLKMAEQRSRKTDEPNETKQSIIETLRVMDLPYIDDLYESMKQTVSYKVNERNKTSIFMAMIPQLQSLPQYNNKTFKDSIFPVEQEDKTGKKVKQSTIKRFGYGLTSEEYLFLQEEYDDWVSRYVCESKAQEELFVRLCFKKLEFFNAVRDGKNTRDLDAGYQELMKTANIAPKQNKVDELSNSKTLGQLIQKWEMERPIPEIDPELSDVDKIGKYLEVFFRGHMAKTVGIKNPFTNIYEKFMRKYTVTKPEYQEGEDSEDIFAKIFGEDDDTL